MQTMKMITKTEDKHGFPSHVGNETFITKFIKYTNLKIAFKTSNSLENNLMRK
jgi:hypothetical protein